VESARRQSPMLSAIAAPYGCRSAELAPGFDWGAVLIPTAGIMTVSATINLYNKRMCDDGSF
jgi:hypothetical protein